ncbi:MAG: hypothetical protein NUV42_02510, partial [Candidatus Yonathbacteria bacterium]|nr:hypothetical protein [Candidatus Yonathbacteria bacterium]
GINTYMQAAWDYYGECSFEFLVIEFCEKEDLIERERFHMETEIPSYNMRIPTAGQIKNNAHKYGFDVAFGYPPAWVVRQDEKRI